LNPVASHRPLFQNSKLLSKASSNTSLRDILSNSQHASRSCSCFSPPRRLCFGYPFEQYDSSCPHVLHKILTCPVDAKLSSALEAVKRDIATVETMVVDKRQLLDLSSVTGLVDEVLSTLTGLLPTIISTVSGLDASVNSIVSGVESDVDGALNTIKSTLQSTVDELNGVINGVDLTGTLDGLVGDVNAAISEVQTLLTDVEGIASSVDVDGLLSEVTSLAQQLLNILTGLASTATSSV